MSRQKADNQTGVYKMPGQPVAETGLDRRTRICIWIILVGLANFLVFTVLYALIWGEAINGQVYVIEGQRRYFLQSGQEVSWWVFVYSGIHSISIWPTVGAIMLAMLTLAKDRIISSGYTTARRGRAMITLLAVAMAIIVCILTFLFARNFIHRMRNPVAPQATTRSATQPAGGAARGSEPDARGLQIALRRDLGRP